MQNLNLLSSDELEDYLWHLGLNSHNNNLDERRQYIDFLKTQKDKCSSKTVLNAVSYIMHTYFFCMTDEEKKDCLNLILNIDIEKLNNFGDVFDIMGILFKRCPDGMEQKILDYILGNFKKCLENPSAIISICNCFSYIFDELNLENKKRVIRGLDYLIEQNPYPLLNDTILFTLNLFMEDVNK